MTWRFQEETIDRGIDIFSGTKAFDEGAESLVYTTLAKEFVVKIPNTNRFRRGSDIPRPQGLLDFNSDPEHGKELEHDHKIAKKIFRDRLPDSWFFNTIHPLTGKMSFAQVQRNLHNIGVKNLEKYPDKKDIITAPGNREDFLELFWQIKKYCHTFRVPYDITLETLGNIGYREGTPNNEPRFYIFEAGFPTSGRKLLFGEINDSRIPIEYKIKQQQYISRKLIPGVVELEKVLDITQEEKEYMNEKYFGRKDFDYNGFLEELLAEYSTIGFK